MNVGAAQVEGVGAQSLILAAGQSRGDDAAHDGGVQLDLGAEVGARESGRGVRGDGSSGNDEAGGVSHSAKQGGDVPNFEASFKGDVVGSGSHKGPPVEFAATRVGDRVDAGVGGEQVEALAGDDVKGRDAVGGHACDPGEDARGDEAGAQPGEGSGPGAHEHAINPRIGQGGGQAGITEGLADERRDGFGVVSPGVVVGAANDPTVFDDRDGGGCLGVQGYLSHGVILLVGRGLVAFRGVLVDARSPVGGDDVLEDAVPAVPVGAQDDAAAAVVHVFQVDDVPVALRLSS